MNHFDDNGDLWIDIQMTGWSETMAKISAISHAIPDPRNPAVYMATTEMNLTDYIRRVINEGSR